MNDETAESVEAVESTEANDGLLAETPAVESTEDKAAEKPDETAGEETGEKATDESTEDYADFSIPEGMELDIELLERANPIFKELGLSQEQAQKLVDFQAETVKEQVAQFNQQVEDWKTAATNDPEYGGENLKASLAVAWKTVEAYFSPTFIDEIKPFGLQNHPELIRGLYKIGKAHLVEDNPSGGRPVSGDKTRAERLYGKN